MDPPATAAARCVWRGRGTETTAWQAGRAHTAQHQVVARDTCVGVSTWPGGNNSKWGVIDMSVAVWPVADAEACSGRGGVECSEGRCQGIIHDYTYNMRIFSCDNTIQHNTT